MSKLKTELERLLDGIRNAENDRVAVAVAKAGIKEIILRLDKARTKRMQEAQKSGIHYGVNND